MYARLRELDLSLLLVVDALLQTGSATAAAQKLGISQSTLSTQLARLRRVLNDDLFVKTPTGLEPTQRALALAPVATRILEDVKQNVLTQPVFNPHCDERRFVIVAGEIGQLVFVPTLLKELRQVAPGVSLRVLGGDVTRRGALIESGEADLAVGLFPDFANTGIFQQKLYPAHPVVCLARADHPLLEQGLSVSLLNSLEHAVVGAEMGYEAFYEPYLKKAGIERRVVAELPTLAAVPWLILNSDLITIVPQTLAALYCQDSRFTMHPLPVSMPKLEVRQFWHRRVHHDPGVVWLRQFIADHFQTAHPLDRQQSITPAHFAPGVAHLRSSVRA